MTFKTREHHRRGQDLAIVHAVFNQDEYKLKALSAVLPVKTILDIGGHIGCFGLKALSLWPDARLVAFEPNPDSARLYRQNLAANGLRGTVVTAAIDANPGKTRLVEDDRSTGGAILFEPDEEVPDAEHRTCFRDNIRVLTLLDAVVMFDLDHVDLLKLDCEGSELGILQTLNDSMNLSSVIGFMVGEYHYRNHAGYGAWAPLVRSRFEDWGVAPIGEKAYFIGEFMAGPKRVLAMLGIEDDMNEELSVVTPLGAVVRFSMPEGPFVEVSAAPNGARRVKGWKEAVYHVEFADPDLGICHFRDTIGPNCWSRSDKKYVINWHVTVTENGAPVFDHSVNFKDRRVLIEFKGNPLGDTLAWIPYCEEFREKHGCEVHVATGWNGLLRGAYPKLKFIEYGSKESYYARFRLGIYDNDYDRNKNNWRTIPLQQVASDFLGLDYKEIRPSVAA